jgi:hypothetical protein
MTVSKNTLPASSLPDFQFYLRHAIYLHVLNLIPVTMPLGNTAVRRNAKPGNLACDDERLMESACAFDVTVIHVISYESNNKVQRCGNYCWKNYSRVQPANRSGFVAVMLFEQTVSIFQYSSH